MCFFNSIYNETTDAFSLERYLEQHLGDFWELYYSTYTDLLEQAEQIEIFVLFKKEYLSELNFSKIENSSFVLALLDVCLRLNIAPPVPILYRIITDNNIQINSRMEAGLRFIYPSPRDANDMINLCEPICRKLQYAIDNEEDNDEKSILTFLYFFKAAIESLHTSIVIQIEQIIKELIDSNTCPFLKKIQILRELDPTVPYPLDGILRAIDNYYENENQHNEEIEDITDYLVEDDTEYSSMLRQIPHCDFNRIRDIAVQKDNGERLPGRGVEILEQEAQLYNYLKSYGNMHKAKILSALQYPFPQHFGERLTIVDWGCGQALASMVFIDKYGGDCIENIVLIEPSQIALKRASLHCKCMVSKAKIKTVNKKLNDVLASDIDCPYDGTIIHLFSNILDIDNYSTKKLVTLFEQNISSTNYVVCVSPYIDEIKTEKIELFINHFRQKPNFEMISEKTNISGGPYWMCNNAYRNPGLEHGGSRYCGINIDTNGCEKRWTRVVRVFKF